MKIGFTGTEMGMTPLQRDTLMDYLWTQNEETGITEFHHGDCVGADAEAHDMALAVNILLRQIFVHPPANTRKRARKRALNVATPKPYLERNHDIVDACDILVACPFGMSEILRSGTWATIRYARKVERPYYIIFPDGTSRYFPSNT